MDSTNSASNQTSTSADNDDFDDEDDVHSQAHMHHHLSSFHTFHPSTATVASSSSIFDAFSPYFTPFPFPPPPPEPALLSLDAAWNSPAAAASASALSPPPQLPFSTPALAAAAPSPPPPPRGPRKRARASRRPSTTVINTETSNFRAMVQQFTGFPTPPFSAAPFSSRPRLDLFGATAAAGVVPPFLLRPSSHKMIPSQSSSSSSSSASSTSLFDHTIASIARSHIATTIIGATPDPSHPIPPKYHDHDKFNLSLFDGNMQRPGESSFSAPPFLQLPPQPQMAPPPDFPSHSAAILNPQWHVEEDQESEQQTPERARSKFHFRNFQNNQT